MAKLTTISMQQIQKAKAFLRKKDITADLISPRTFAAASAQLGVDFGELLILIGRLLDGGSNVSSSPITLSMLKHVRGKSYGQWI